MKMENRSHTIRHERALKLVETALNAVEVAQGELVGCCPDKAYRLGKVRDRLIELRIGLGPQRGLGR